MGLVPLQEEEKTSILSLCTMGGHSKNAAVCKPERRLLAGTLILDFSAFNTVRNSIVCLSHLVYSILLHQPSRLRHLPKPQFLHLPNGVIILLESIVMRIT